MSEFLKRYIETSLFAATVLLFAKLVGVWIGLSITKVTFSLVTVPEIFTYVSVASLDQVRQVSTIADGVFVATLVVVGTLVLIKTILFNDLTRHPRVLVKVIHYNLTGWLEDGQSMYPRLFAWGTFFWLACILVVRDYMVAKIPLALPITLGLFTVIYSYQVFNFLETHISDMISYLYGTKRKTT
ncbi:hypothetical protein CO112_00670 [Candidatus Dojkabacteria bacterium CG_4_9_14_3_um_filter_150_Dojkabacteria_WS6_41_13]|uniref:Uncharacterized protein n=1 Tax=Candidatus Dojkabacteria bacterium CG_4_10_14_0_2_um_filter_Dojkabacteria_WS6_41_15 TaxID=2014249 RepID=A0A2M7W358_9BACT|nr:MAG: hypothetical protein COZ14_00980 [Candidatus Dojkabacteria bacterium CG_4_10_14_3_um_filter_Dojkabacteria_WS6_41_9]PJA15755.1 MAG: hypothetical protein COX64_00365 [Candidatus Dojkabacteria bacterium CG_4_10_14_0_2_um_filter_Dojkabacteria_WS6_41_15]PJB23523.1 MAG: hypothetical protein CO112_00670 [Candidatus Dojkabacteria bacterium CG_4_9_14_3_um_filter_150_Dojkabacteria_WS6_41_13]